MIQYKTVCIPNTPCRGVKKREFRKGLTLDTCNKAVAPIGQAIQNEGMGGWKLESIECLPQVISRKKGILEFLLGWIPIVGKWLFPDMQLECKIGLTFDFYVLVFSKEA